MYNIPTTCIVYCMASYFAMLKFHGLADYKAFAKLISLFGHGMGMHRRWEFSLNTFVSAKTIKSNEI